LRTCPTTLHATEVIPLKPTSDYRYALVQTREKADVMVGRSHVEGRRRGRHIRWVSTMEGGLKPFSLRGLLVEDSFGSEVTLDDAVIDQLVGAERNNEVSALLGMNPGVDAYRMVDRPGGEVQDDSGIEGAFVPAEFADEKAPLDVPISVEYPLIAKHDRQLAMHGLVWMTTPPDRIDTLKINKLKAMQDPNPTFFDRYIDGQDGLYYLSARPFVYRTTVLLNRPFTCVESLERQTRSLQANVEEVSRESRELFYGIQALVGLGLIDCIELGERNKPILPLTDPEKPLSVDLHAAEMKTALDVIYDWRFAFMKRFVEIQQILDEVVDPPEGSNPREREKIFRIVSQGLHPTSEDPPLQKSSWFFGRKK